MHVQSVAAREAEETAKGQLLILNAIQDLAAKSLLKRSKAYFCFLFSLPSFHLFVLSAFLEFRLRILLLRYLFKMASAEASNSSLTMAPPQRKASSPTTICVSTPPDDISPPMSSLDGDPTLTATLKEDTTAVEADFAKPDWKITIQSTDGSTSEVNLRQKEIRISMIADKLKMPEKSILSATEKESPLNAPEAEKVDPSKEVSVPKEESKLRFRAHTPSTANRSSQAKNLDHRPTRSNSLIIHQHHRHHDHHPRHLQQKLPRRWRLP